MKRGILAVAVITAALALITGCGGDDSETASGGDATSVTKAQFIDQANAVCKEVVKEKNVIVKDQLDQYEKEGKSLELDEKNGAAVAEKALPPVTKLPEKLRAVGAPEGEEEKVEAMIEAFEKGVSEMEEDASKIYAANYPFKKGDELALKVGLTTCRF